MTVSQQIPDNIKRTARAVGYALWLGGADNWFGLALILRARLTPDQRAALAYMALRSLDPEHAEQVASGVLDHVQVRAAA
ncbi:hypothetical protein AB9K41_02120 [Cribrihabitans sp. XS_ASV171]